MGLENVAEVSGGTIVTAAGMADLSGYTLTFTAQEKKPANFIDSPTASDPFAGMASATASITSGSDF